MQTGPGRPALASGGGEGTAAAGEPRARAQRSESVPALGQATAPSCSSSAEVSSSAISDVWARYHPSRGGGSSLWWSGSAASGSTVAAQLHPSLGGSAAAAASAPAQPPLQQPPPPPSALPAPLTMPAGTQAVMESSAFGSSLQAVGGLGSVGLAAPAALSLPGDGFWRPAQLPAPLPHLPPSLQGMPSWPSLLPGPGTAPGLQLHAAVLP
mmetsp:Transcript_114640/g.278354  ORF Transcript_114640/g.278354 Transcript_114640/m.278354 type:complete len:211 (+) Transcript_114640:1-633(+)